MRRPLTYEAVAFIALVAFAVALLLAALKQDQPLADPTPGLQPVRAEVQPPQSARVKIRLGEAAPLPRSIARRPRRPRRAPARPVSQPSPEATATDTPTATPAPVRTAIPQATPFPVRTPKPTRGGFDEEGRTGDFDTTGELP